MISINNFDAGFELQRSTPFSLERYRRNSGGGKPAGAQNTFEQPIGTVGRTTI
jgi:hypothetical protein